MANPLSRSPDGLQIVLVLFGLSAPLFHEYPYDVFKYGGINFFYITGGLFLLCGIPFINLQVVVVIVIVVADVVVTIIIVW